MVKIKKGKFFNQKKWYSINNAVRRLSDFFDDELTENDILSLVKEGSIPLSWYPPHLYGEPCLDLEKNMFDSKNVCKFESSVQLEIKRSPELKRYIHWLVDDGVVESEFDEPMPFSSSFQLLVANENGDLYRALLPRVESQLQGMPNSFQKKFDKSIFGVVCFFPSISQLGFTKENIEKFIDIQKNEKLDPRYEDNLLRIILGLSQKHYKYDPNSKSNTAASNISGMLLLDYGINVGVRTIRERLREASELPKQEMEK